MEESLKLKRATYHLYTFMISKLISTFGSQVYAFAISFYILQLTGSATSFATNLLCNILPRTLAGPFAGAITDRYSRKMIVIVSQIATTLAITGLLIYTLTSGLSLIAIYTTTSILSLTSMFSGIAFTSSITGLIDQPRIQKATAMNQMAISFAAIGSPAVGGLLYGTVSIPVFLIIFILASIIAVILESTMNFRLFAVVNKIEEQKETMWQSMKAGIRYLRVQSTILVILWISLLINFFFGAFEVGYSYILIENLKMQSQHFGFTQGAFSLGMLLMSVYFSARKEVKFPLIVSKRGIVGLGAIIGFIALPLLLPMVYWTMFGYYLVLMFCFGILIITVNTPLHVMFQKTIDDDYKGRVFSIVETMSMALTPLGMVIYGVLYDIFPAQWVLLLSAAMLIIITVSMMRTSVIRKVHPEWKGKQVVYKVKARSVAR
ncbi:MFS transporter [Sutcliffiella horikoshii]|uniref:MFS transporter n=1 Tax=Sutcliffiella horikoshii TaxID=79883 RepID=UPI001F48CDF4|nr:MFS transporter [Sutcliffiella horikoshii]MCG1023301.1 MFS transporter [Sutcliffiella horikoshii]